MESVPSQPIPLRPEKEQRRETRKGLQGGRNVGLVVGIDLNDRQQQQEMWRYLEKTTPLVVVMSPTCRPFGGWSHFNRTMHPEAWQRSLEQALPHAILCSKVALWQDQQQRYFIVEQPETSDMWLHGDWPKVLGRPSVECICFDQCQ
eukprot:5498028-Amphidinium_carterae.1